MRGSGVTLFALGLLGVLLISVGAPAGAALLMSLRTGLPGEGGPLTLANFIEVYSDPRTYDILLNTFLFAVGTVTVTIVFAAPLVWLLTRTDIPFKQTVYVLLVVGILVPVFLRTIAWILLLSPRIGLVNQLAQKLLHLDQPLVSLYNIPAMAFIQGISFVPGAVFMLAAAYRNIDPAMEEAAYTAGVSKLRTVLSINIPITLPAIAGVMVYLFMTTIAVFEVPAIIGLPARILVLSSLVFTSVNPSAGLPNYGLAGAYGSFMLMAGLILAYFYLRVVRESKKYIVISGRGYRPKEIALGPWKWAAILFVLVYLSVGVFIPFLMLLWTSLLRYPQLPTLAALSTVSLTNYWTIPNYVGIAPFINTISVMLTVPTAVMLMSVLVSWVVVRTNVSFRGILDTMAFLPHALPSILMAVGLGYLSIVYRNFFPIYGTIVIIIIAHTISWLAYGTRTMNSIMIQLHQELEEAGRVVGASTPSVLRFIVLPLIAQGVLNGWIWIGMLSYREVTMALTLYSRENAVISTITWQLWSTGYVPQASALGVVLMLFAIILIAFLKGVFSKVGQIGSGT